MSTQHRNIEIVYLNTHLLRRNPRNPRTHSQRQKDRLTAIIKEVGMVSPIVVDEHNMVLAGHARLAAAKKLGLTSVPTVRLDGLSDVVKRAYILADNKIAESAGWDRDLLMIELGELIELLPANGLDITLTGFEAGEIDILDADLGEDDPDDELPPHELSIVTRPGDLWLLGRHRLLCGDARSKEDLDRVLAQGVARLVATDPPYNVNIDGHVQGRGRTKHSEFAFASGEMSDAQYAAFLRASLSNAARCSAPGALHYVFMDWRHIAILIGVGTSIYARLLNICVWNKTNAGQGSFYRSQHELVAVFRVGDAPHQNNVELGRFGRNRSNVWTYAGVNSFGAGRAEALANHPTVKPVALVADLLRDCTAKGDLVLDPFSGSGTTLIAAERLGRRCCAIEYAPRYVDVAVRRWEAATKRDAVLEGDGRTFSELQAERDAPLSHQPQHGGEDPPLDPTGAETDAACVVPSSSGASVGDDR